jgi:predicted DNA-binding transcriptional regulator YafY
MSRPEGAPESEEQIASFRVTRLTQVRRRSHPRGRLTADDRRDIEEKIRQVGVQYLIGTGDRICVRLTQKGRREFLQRSYMRPMPERVEKDLYYFSCTSMQVRNYFLSFGADAEILEPESLRQEFIRVYREALDHYEKS